MGKKVIITVAPTGSISTRKDNPNIPYTAEEVAAETEPTVSDAPQRRLRKGKVAESAGTE